MPCLDLEIIKEQGVRAVQKWAGQNFIITLKEPARGLKTGAHPHV